MINSVICPTACLSSQLTSELLEFRNPQGHEKNWLYQSNHIDNYFVHITKTAIVDIVSPLLSLSALIESVAYGVIFISALPLLFFTDKFSKNISHLFSSCTFTILWNLNNVAINHFCINLATKESFARFTLDNWPRGMFFKLIIKTISIVLSILGKKNIDVCSTTMRNIDRTYIEKWLLDNRIIHNILNLVFIDPYNLLSNFSLNELRMIQSISNILRDEIQEKYEINDESSIAEGISFFKETILSQIDSETKTQILEMSPEAIIFTLTSSINTYVLGSRKNAPIPFFFQNKTRKSIKMLRYAIGVNQNDPIPSNLDKKSIQRLRTKFSNISEQNLKQASLALKTITQFTELSETDSNDNIEVNVILNSMKNIAWEESQGESLFLRHCWQKACESKFSLLKNIIMKNSNLALLTAAASIAIIAVNLYSRLEKN
ncbi:MAG: hypothetical protein WCT85_04410 [Parachlamydiales bacterium]|jgi:hypothetical protein